MSRNIPKIIHQVWSNICEPLPQFFSELMETWEKCHPGWEYVLWDNEMMNSFMRKFYTDYWIPYNSIKYNIQKWDMIRYFILYHYGGMYADADYECLESFDPLLENSNNGCYLSAEPVQHAHFFGLTNF